MNNAGETLYWDRGRVVECLLKLENKQQIMHNNVEIKLKGMYTCIRNILIIER